MLPDGPEITYQEEAYSAVLPELEACLKAHWQEVAQDQERMPLDVDYKAYATLEALDLLHVVTVRVDGDLAGYVVTFLRPHLHYQQTLCGYVDVYYIKPGYRLGYLALRLFRYAEASLRARGVQKLFAGTKTYKDMGLLFRRLQWVETETLYTKWLGA